MTYAFSLSSKLFFKLVNDMHSTKISFLACIKGFYALQSYLMHFCTNPYSLYHSQCVGSNSKVVIN